MPNPDIIAKVMSTDEHSPGRRAAIIADLPHFAHPSAAR
jgi:hypothetical protein